MEYYFILILLKMITPNSAQNRFIEPDGLSLV